MFKKSLVNFNSDLASEPVITENVRINGNIAASDTVRLDCVVNGDISADILIIGKTGNITGNIICNHLTLSGVVRGQIDCAGRMIIKETGILKGDIIVGMLSIEEGAEFIGNCTKSEGYVLDNKEPIMIVSEGN